MDKEVFLNGLCFITNTGEYQKSIIDIALEVMQAGVKWIQLRQKDVSRQKIYKMARMLKTITSVNNVTFIINDHPDIAMAVDADGVHLGQDDFPIEAARKIMGRKIIGISTHTLDEAIDAEKKGADYIGVGPIFHTDTKDAGKPRGIDGIREVSMKVKVPIVAIGGINAENLSDVFRSGANAVAVASGITLYEDVSNTAAHYMELITNL